MIEHTCRRRGQVT